MTASRKARDSSGTIFELRETGTHAFTGSCDNGTKRFSPFVTLPVNQPFTSIHQTMSSYSVSEIASSLDRLEQTVRRALEDGTILKVMKKEKKTMVGGFVAT